MHWNRQYKKHKMGEHVQKDIYQLLTKQITKKNTHYISFEI